MTALILVESREGALYGHRMPSAANWAAHRALIDEAARQADRGV